MKGLQLQRRIMLSKNIWLNISKSGVGVSVGLMGLRLSSGPRGTYLNVDLPGTGLRYRKQLHSRTSTKSPKEFSAQTQENEDVPDPGLFASGHEKELAKGLEDYFDGKEDEALKHLLAAASKESGAAILAGFLLSEKYPGNDRSVTLLEQVVELDEPFPTPLMEKYLADVTVDIKITPGVIVEMPINALAATLLLFEAYQNQHRVREAIVLLEQLEQATHEPTLTLSLVELYASRNRWNKIIDRVKDMESLSNVSLKTLIFYGQAMQQKGLHEAAITTFSKAIRRKKDRNTELLNEACYWRAISYRAQGHRDKAYLEFQRLYAEAPHFKDVAKQLAEFTKVAE